MLGSSRGRNFKVFQSQINISFEFSEFFFLRYFSTHRKLLENHFFPAQDPQNISGISDVYLYREEKE